MAAPMPAVDFATRFTVPLVSLRAGQWWRLSHFSRKNAVDWDDRPGDTRFVPASGKPEVLYLSSDKRTAFWEVFAARLLPLAPVDRVLPPSVLQQRQWVEFDVPGGFQVFDATNIRAVRFVGASNMSFHGDWGPSQAWAEALWKHQDSPDGILYRSDKNHQRCVAIFRRPSRRGRTIKGAFAGLLAGDRSFLAAMRRDGHIV